MIKHFCLLRKEVGKKMRLQVIILVISYVAELHASKNEKNDADKRMNPAFLESIRQGLDEELELNYFRQEGDGDGPIMEVIKDNALHELLQDTLPEISSGGVASLAQIYKFESRSQQKGIDSLQAVADHVKQKLNLSHAGLTPIVKETTSDYIAMLKKYFSDLAREKPSSAVDKEYIILDMVNIVSLMRSKCSKSLLKKILALAKNTSNDEIEILIGTLHIFNENDKQQEMDFMCASFKICRPNPTFSDYLFRSLDDALYLNNRRLKYFLTIISKLLLTKRPFFKTVLRDEIFDYLKAKLSILPTVNATELRNMVSFIHSILLRRYKINRTNDIKIQTKAKSAYIIFDIVDVAFGIDGKDLYGPPMEKIISLTREWSGKTINEVDTTLHDTIQYIVEAMTYNFSKRAKEEIFALADIIFYEKNGNQNGTEYLLTEGSKFVKGLVHQPEPRKIWL